MTPSDRYLIRVLPYLTIGLVLTAWELGARKWGGSLLPPPSAVLVTLIRDPKFYAWHTCLTLVEAAVGLALAVFAAFMTATLFARSSLAHTALMPIVLAAQTVPLLAIGPLLAQAIGEGIIANILVTAYLCWFPSVIAFTHGFLTVDPNRLALFEMHNASREQTWLRLRLPSSAPSALAGIRISAGTAVIAALVSEYDTMYGGIGALMMRNVRGMQILTPEQLYVLVMLASLAGLLFTGMVYQLSRRALRNWLPDEQSSAP